LINVEFLFADSEVETEPEEQQESLRTRTRAEGKATLFQDSILYVPSNCLPNARLKIELVFLLAVAKQDEPAGKERDPKKKDDRKAGKTKSDGKSSIFQLQNNSMLLNNLLIMCMSPMIIFIFLLPESKDGGSRANKKDETKKSAKSDGEFLFVRL